ncbi:hypothetical protein CRE_07186 [Caenorhabditis remanei]|uniref:F-box associated domain-containing protein n=1 Tax=Caenorhabditis remanei TaxID=31234 RepID=E3NV22_CAERE|nr:hypothetical protein CRE_07186 [Caenorhabditis remanei]
MERKHLIIEGVHTYLYELFGLSVEYEIESDLEKLPPSLKYINRSAIQLPKNTTGEELELCFAASPNQEYVSITDSDDFELESNSILYGVQHLHMDMNGHCAHHILFNFRGKSLLLSSVILLNSSLVRFLNEWKSNKGFVNLRFFSISLGNLDDVWIKNRVDIKQSEVALELKWKMR